MADVFERPKCDLWALNAGWRAFYIPSTQPADFQLWWLPSVPPGRYRTRGGYLLPPFFTTEDTIFMTIKPNGFTHS